MERWRISAGVLLLSACVALVPGTTEAQAASPKILRESVSRLGRRGKQNFRARIETGDLTTRYELWINYQPCLYLECELLEEDPKLRVSGEAIAADRAVNVHTGRIVPFTGLYGALEAESYEYWFVASNADGSVKGPRQDPPQQ